MNKISHKLVRINVIFFIFICNTCFGQPGSGNIIIKKIIFKDSITKTTDSTTFIVKFLQEPLVGYNSKADPMMKGCDILDSTLIDSNYLKFRHVYPLPTTGIWLNHEYGNEILLIYFKDQLMCIRLNDVDRIGNYLFNEIPFRSGNFKIDLSDEKMLHYDKVITNFWDITPANWDNIKQQSKNN